MIIMSFNDFLHKYGSKKRVTSNIENQQIFSFLSLNDVVIYLGDGPFSIVMGIVNLHTFQGTHGGFKFKKAILIHMVVHFL